MGMGALSGYVLHGAGRYGHQSLGMLKGATFSRSTSMMSVLAGGAFGSFLMAQTAGKNEVHNLHPIFEAGKQVRMENLSEYEQVTNQAKQEEWERDLDIERRRQNRVMRRNSLQNTFQRGGGL